MLYLHFIYSFLFLTIINVSNCEENVEIELLQGRLLGTINETYYSHTFFRSFRGIPYAEPPVGVLRFQPPQPHRGWESIYNAQANKPLCIQFNSRLRNKEKLGISGSEDCLYLNIYTPAKEGLYPVVVFDYNDNFKSSFNETTYSPDLFIEKDVAVVTINHRMGVLGYLTTEDGVIPPNNGIKDFILALKWIQDNIEYFYGDPNNVTLMGSRGGAALIELLLYTEKAKGLFHKVIMQSGTAMEPTYFSNQQYNNAFKLGNLLNITADDSEMLLEKLRDVSAIELINKGLAVENDDVLDTHQLSVVPFTPVVDTSAETVINSLPEKNKIVNDVPVLIGFNSRNGLDLISPIIFEPRLIINVTYDNFFLHFPIRSNFRFDRNATNFDRVIQEIWDFYFQIGYVSPNYVYEYAVYIGDVLQDYAVNYAAKKIANEVESPVYYYMFDFRGVLNENSQYISQRARVSLEHWGATVGDELCYLYFCNRIRDIYDELNKLVSEQQEIKTLKKMVRLWTNFIKTGNPTPSDEDEILKNIKWTPMNKSEANYLHINRKPSMKYKPLGEREEFWNKFLDKYSKLADDGVVKITIKDEL